MRYDFLFFFNSMLLGVGLAMDAFSVSMANGLNEPRMKPGRICLIAGTFAFFQWLMPMAGWVCVHTIVQVFGYFETLIPWIALVLLGFIGGKMIAESVHGGAQSEEQTSLTLGALALQGVATSIDALSVGFTIADYDLLAAFLSSLIIAAVTFVICVTGVQIGKLFGTRLAGKAGILGGVILIAIGLEIFCSSFF
ncbi:MAG: manganese efflux pump MntP family protein [Firmicutes bacterium]|nr:manganese efflux pump MntP family protein [Bacillota bacterium]